MPDWVQHLQAFIKDHALEASADFDAEHDVERRFRQIMDGRRKREMEADPTLREVPRFYFKRPAATDPLPGKLRQAAQRRFVARKQEELLLGAHRAQLSELLEELQSPPEDGTRRINYDDFQQLGRAVAPRGRDLFTPATFLQFRRDRFGRIQSKELLEHLNRESDVAEYSIRLSMYDVQGRGFLREPDVENYIYELIPLLQGLQAMQDNFYFYYVCTAVRRFFFFLDPKRTGRVSIHDVAHSTIHGELRELELSDGGSPENWFSYQHALRVYSQYLELDVDQNGMLTKSELTHYVGASSYPMRLTDAFVSRVFQEYHTYSGEMDYKTFLDFTLAVENKNTPQSLQYFFRILDVEKKGYLTTFDINFFFREVVHALWENGQDPIAIEDVRDEIFDMVKPADPLKITLEDLKACRVGHIVVSILTDVNGFWMYDNRENMMHGDDEDDDEDGEGGPGDDDFDDDDDDDGDYDSSVASVDSGNDGGWF